MSLLASPISPKFMGGASDPIALGSATWTNGYYLDLRTLGLVDGATLSSDITPQVGAGVFTPVNSPTVDGVGILGRTAVLLTKGDTSCLTAHWAAALVSGSNQPFTWIGLGKKRDGVGTRYLVSFCTAAEPANAFHRIRWAGGYAAPTSERDAVGEATKTISGAGTYYYKPRVVAIVFDGSTGTLYVDGAVQATGDLNTLSIAFDRHAIGATFTTAPGFAFDGWIQCAALTEQVLTQAQVQTVEATWRAAAAAHPGDGGTQIAWLGDSITWGGSDTGPYAYGFRGRIYEYCRAASVAVDSVGGETPAGYFADPEHMSHSGYLIASIRTVANASLGTGNGYEGVKFAAVMAGTNNMDNVEAGSPTMSATLDDYASLLSAMHTRLVTTQPTARIMVTTILPIQTGWPGATVVDTFNAGLTAIWDAHDAAHPSNLLLRADAHTAIGGAWSATYFDADPVHPNSDGYDLIAAHYWSVCGSYLASIGV